MKYRYQVHVDLVLEDPSPDKDLREWLREFVKSRLSHPDVVDPKVKVFYEGRDE